MRIYEITFLIDPSLSPEEAGKCQEKIKEIIGKEEGIPGKEQPPVKKTLAYSIKNHKEAYLSSLGFEVKEEKIGKIKKNIEQDNKILRYLAIKKQISKRREKRRREPIKKKTLKPEKAKLNDIDKKIEEIL